MREKLKAIVDEALAKTDRSEGEQKLEIVAEILRATDIPQHQEEIGLITDSVNALLSRLTEDPERMSPEQLKTRAMGSTSEEGQI